jgi:Ca2+-binding RTX toxin-like protein
VGKPLVSRADQFLVSTGGNDLLDGGRRGFDTVSYATAASAVTVDLSVSGPQNTVGAGSDTLIGIDRVIGSAWNDHLVGNAGDNTFEGGGGVDLIEGGGGSDTVSYASQGEVVVDLAPGTGWNGFETDVLVSIENATGSNFSDTLRGDGGANVLSGLSGNDFIIGYGGDDVIDGGAGFDTTSYTDASGGVTVNLSLTSAQNTGVGFDTLISIESLVGSAFNDILIGSDASNTLNGGDGDDALTGGLGKDMLIGGAGADRYVFTSAADSTNSAGQRDVVWNFTAGEDKIDLSAIDAIRGGKDSAFTLVGAFSGAEGQLLVIDDPDSADAANILVLGDINGDGLADFGISVHLLGGAITASDFIL